MTKHPVEVLYEKRMEEAKALPPAEADYHALEQGVYGTDLRHKAVLDHVKGLDGIVLDLGCGTGLFLDKMAERGIKPTQYNGIDGMEERMFPVINRTAALGIPASFRHKPMDVRFEEIVLPRSDAALFIGVMGFWGYHTQRHVLSMYSTLRVAGHHGCMTFPMIWDSQQMGDLYLRRWDVTDVQDLLRLKDENIVVLEREFVIYW